MITVAVPRPNIRGRVSRKPIFCQKGFRNFLLNFIILQIQIDRKCLFIVLYFRSSCASTSEKSSSSSLKRLSASSTRNKRDRKERKEVFSREKSSKKSVMGGNVSRGIRHAHRDGGAGRGGTAASKAGGGNSETKMPTRLEMLLDMPTVSRETQIKNAWNSESRNISSTSFSQQTTIYS